MIAHGRNEQKASEQELIDCPAPESTYQMISIVSGCGRCASHSTVAAPIETFLIFDGNRFAGTLSGYTMSFVDSSNFAEP